MSDLNMVQVIGRLGKDPDMRYTPSGAAVANITVATGKKWKDKQSGEQKEKTEWHKIVFFGRSAEVIGEFCSKGSSLCVEGSLQTRKWQDKEGNDRYSTEVKGDRFQFLGSKGGGNQQESAPRKPDPAPKQDEEFEEDIPF